MKKKIVFLLALSVILLTMATMHSTLAYFTTYATARGGYTIELGNQTEINEKFYAWTKHVTISNDENSQPVYVRVKAFCGSVCKLTYFDNVVLKPKYEKGEELPLNWTLGDDGYVYYNNILLNGESTVELQIKISDYPGSSDSKPVKDGDSFNVVVIYETAPVRYDEEGNPYANWTATLDSGSTGNGEGGND